MSSDFTVMQLLSKTLWLAFPAGLVFGSFLNVCISRLPEHESVVKPRSRCPFCGNGIRWHDNVPVLSWLLLRGNCRDCAASISLQYPAVEIAVGSWFVVVAHLLALKLQWLILSTTERDIPASLWANSVIPLVATAALGFLLIGLLVMDWQTHLLPDSFTLTGTAIGFFLVCTQAVFLTPGQEDVHLNPTTRMRITSPGSFVELGNVALTGPEHLVFGRLAAIIGAALVPLLIRTLYKGVRGREGLGLGDVKLMAMIAAFLGFWPAVLALFAGCLLIMPYAVFLLASKRADGTTQLPFGSFFAIGGLIAAVAGERLFNWYGALLN